MRPIALSSPVPAIPTTRVEKTSGAMIILMRRRKASAKGLVAVPNGGQMYPTAMPSTSAIRIWAVRPGRRFTTRAHFSFAPGPTRGAERLRLVGRRQLRILDLGRRQTAHERGDHVHHALLLRSE